MPEDQPAGRRVTMLAGGVGGSKLVSGVAHARVALTVIGNVGDDVERHGLWVSPDMDILTYTLAGVVDTEKGWGFAEETFHTLGALGRLGEKTWMNLGDRDLATHILRTRLRREGVRPTEIALRIADGLGATARILVPTDDPLQTIVHTDNGRLNFQEFFLREQCKPQVLDVTYEGSPHAKATAESVEAVREAQLLLIAPSNPPGSIGPILAVSGLREALASATAFRLAVCPIVGGQSLKGPSDRMLRALGFEASPIGVAEYYGNLIDGLVIDEQDSAFAEPLEGMGLDVLVANTVMETMEDRVRLALEILGWAPAAR